MPVNDEQRINRALVNLQREQRTLGQLHAASVTNFIIEGLRDAGHVVLAKGKFRLTRKGEHELGERFARGGFSTISYEPCVVPSRRRRKPMPKPNEAPA